MSARLIRRLSGKTVIGRRICIRLIWWRGNRRWLRLHLLSARAIHLLRLATARLLLIRVGQIRRIGIHRRLLALLSARLIRGLAGEPIVR